jgi:hypothetical protein
MLIEMEDTTNIVRARSTSNFLDVRMCLIVRTKSMLVHIWMILDGVVQVIFLNHMVHQYNLSRKLAQVGWIHPNKDTVRSSN